MENNIETHLFSDTHFFFDDSNTLILGSFPVPLYTQKEKFNLLDDEEKNNAWYYSSKKSEFWKLIAYSFDIDNKDFLVSKELKKKLFYDKRIAIADVFYKCKRKNKNSSKDTDLIIVEYNNLIVDIIKNIKLIIFTSRFTENNFFKILKNNNIEYSLIENEKQNVLTLSKEIINAVRERYLIIKNKKIKIATITLKISPIKGVSLYSTKQLLFKHYLNN
ncbi:uracil-DNA glycosylase family protein [Brachyspira pilosicoli]|uniref:uracil-DNA glycosylase family protein n=1 Tax=Brachyspira pilosicoli TaxID=52584 RepID=UPI003003E3E8